jgi:hypothetical protein
MLERTINTRGVRINTAQNRRAQDAYEQVVREVTAMFGASSTVLMVTNKDEDLVLKVSDIPGLKKFTMPLKGGVMGKCASTATTLVVNDLERTPYYDPEKHDNYRGTGKVIRAILAAPLISTTGEVLGVIECFKPTGIFSRDDERRLSSVAGLLALNIEGEGSSIRSALQQLKRQQVAEQRSQTHDCSAELDGILQHVFSLVKRGGGHVNESQLEDLPKRPDFPAMRA